MDTIVSQVRHFMKEYQFTTDAYRLFATLVRLCQSPLSHLTKGPTTKFILRNIKTMDFSLVRHNLKEGNAEFRGMASYTGRDANGKLIVNTEMDICLLLLYGHILFVNTSFGKALRKSNLDLFYNVIFTNNLRLPFPSLLSRSQKPNDKYERRSRLHPICHQTPNPISAICNHARH